MTNEHFIFVDNARYECISMQNLPHRHSRVSGNPACQTLRAADKAVFEVTSHFVGEFLNRLDSRLCGNDGCYKDICHE